jgi:hypothetical protein
MKSIVTIGVGCLVLCMIGCGGDGNKDKSESNRDIAVDDPKDEHVASDGSRDSLAKSEAPGPNDHAVIRPKENREVTMSEKLYEYPTGNIELAIRANEGESLPDVLQDIHTKWTPGNEHLWDDYDLDSLIDTPEKRGYFVNQLLYSRITVYRALRDEGNDIRGSDPFEHVEQVPELFSKRKAQFPDVLK